MKIIFLSSFFIFILSGCSDDISSFSKEECTELGYTYTNEKRLNYRTGKYEMKFFCEDKTKK
jgi:hypothetical protein